MSAPDLTTARRWGLAAVLAFDVVHLAGSTWLAAIGEPMNAEELSLFATLARSRLALLLLAALGLAGAFRFARRPGQWLWGLLTLACVFCLLPIYVAVHPDFPGPFFYPGATLAGWLGGLGLAHALGYAHLAERAAVLGAMTTLAATQVNAGVATLAGLGGSWFEPWALHLGFIMDHPAGSTSILDGLWQGLLDAPDLTRALAGVVLASYLAMVLYPLGPRLRRVTGSFLLVTTVLMALVSGLTPIRLALLLLLFTYDWGLSDAPAPEPTTAPAPRARYGVLSGVGLAAAAALWLVLPGSALGGGRESADAEVILERPIALASLGPLTTGDPLPEGWTLSGIERDPSGEVRVELTGADHRVVHLGLSGPEGPTKRGLGTVGALNGAYYSRFVPYERAKQAISGLTESLVAAGGDDLIASWRAWVKAAPELP